MKTNRIGRIALGVSAGIVLLAGMVWLLIRTLGDNPQPLFVGKPIPYWQAALNDRDPAISNEAFVVVNGQVIPKLTDTMLHDTNDSKVRLLLVDTLNGLPGVQIYFTPAGGRRAAAALMIGMFGPAAKSAIPVLQQAVKGTDPMVKGPALQALGNIHSDPQVVIPFLIEYLGDDNLDDEAALALGNYGSLAQAAVPKIIPLLHAPDKDAQVAAAVALKKIDPEAYKNAVQAGNSNATSRPSHPSQ